MPRPYTSEDYETLARAVLAGMPTEQAEKTITEQRELGGIGEGEYWLTIQHETKYAKTTIQITQGFKAELGELKVHERESYQEVLDRIVKQAEKVPALENEILELKKQIAELVGIVENEYGITKGDE